MSVLSEIPVTAVISKGGEQELIPKVAEYLGSLGFDCQRGDQMIWADVSGGEWRIEERGDSLHISILAPDAAVRQRLCDTASYLIEHVAPSLAGALQWQGLGDAGALPANMQIARLISVDRISPSFLRVRVGCGNIAAFMSGGMHFSVLLPPEGRSPVWPCLNEAGRTIWPKGEDKLHRAAYTFVGFDAEQGWFDFDVYAHEGGPTTLWLERAEAGAELAISGPGGGDFPELAADGSTQLVMAGDETALPAIRRILEHAPAGQRGYVILETADARDRIIGEMPEGIILRHLDRSKGESLAAEYQTLPVPADGSDFQLWLAAEQKMVREARAFFLQQKNLPKAQCYMSAYWTAAS